MSNTNALQCCNLIHLFFKCITYLMHVLDWLQAALQISGMRIKEYSGPLAKNFIKISSQSSFRHISQFESAFQSSDRS